MVFKTFSIDILRAMVIKTKMRPPLNQPARLQCTVKTRNFGIKDKLTKESNAF